MRPFFSNVGFQSVRRACGETLGELIAVLKSTALQEAIEKEPKENKKQSLQKLSARTFQDALGTVFYEAASNNKKVTFFSQFVVSRFR